MAISPLVERLLAQSQQYQTPPLSPLAPLGKIALAAALRAREKRDEKSAAAEKADMEARQKTLLDVLSGGAPTSSQISLEGVNPGEGPTNYNVPITPEMGQQKYQRSLLAAMAGVDPAGAAKMAAEQAFKGPPERKVNFATMTGPDGKDVRIATD